MTNLNQPRVPAGNPAGGRWTSKCNPESRTQLFPEGEMEWLSARKKELEAGGYQGPGTLHPNFNVNRQLRARDWWSMQAVLQERNHAEGDYPAMAEGDRTKDKQGRLVGTQRREYVGAGVSLRMPSVTAIRRFADNTESRTFDVPVSANTPAGRTVGWVRVTRDNDGRWAVRGLNMTKEESFYISEAVQAQLSAQRVTGELSRIGDLTERRRQRASEAGARGQAVHSTWIRELGYDQGTGTMFMETGGRHYGYKTSPQTYLSVLKSHSPGSDFNTQVKKRAERVGVTKCDSCGRWSAQGTQHRCPPREDHRPLTRLH